MEKECKNCYWKHTLKNECILHQTKELTVCEDFKSLCDECQKESGDFKYRGHYYCKDCILDMLEIGTYTITHYQTCNGEYLGDDNTSFIDILTQVDAEIEEVY